MKMSKVIMLNLNSYLSCRAVKLLFDPSVIFVFDGFRTKISFVKVNSIDTRIYECK